MKPVQVIRTDDQYHDYLAEVQTLLAASPAPGTPQGERLELLTVLLESYEARKYPIEAPDPVDAILFRMQEKGLKQADLVPYFGTRSRVSEVLGRKRPLTVQMIRALAVGLGLSADTLVGIDTAERSKHEDLDWSKFPIKEMAKRGWIKTVLKSRVQDVETVVRNFIADAGLQFGAAAFRRSIGGEAESPLTRHALYAWLARVVQRARNKSAHLPSFNSDVLSAAFLKELAQLSWFEHGPLLAVEYLERHGIAVVIEPHMKGTLLDGAALKDSSGMPIVALTLRYDRLDNFWFTLLHEVAHIWKHIDASEAFLDDLDVTSEDRREAEANRLAKEAFIPRVLWKRSEAFIAPSRDSIDRLARELKIHPAIIAGRIRRESGNYGLFADLVGNQQVKAMFLSLSEA